MSIEEEAKALVGEYVRAFNQGDLNALKTLLAVDAEMHGVLGKGIFEELSLEPLHVQGHYPGTFYPVTCLDITLGFTQW